MHVRMCYVENCGPGFVLTQMRFYRSAPEGRAEMSFNICLLLQKNKVEWAAFLEDPSVSYYVQ